MVPNHTNIYSLTNAITFLAKPSLRKLVMNYRMSAKRFEDTACSGREAIYLEKIHGNSCRMRGRIGAKEPEECQEIHVELMFSFAVEYDQAPFAEL